MPERSPGAHVVRRRLGRSLRELRERANIRIEAAARELECSPAKISRLENGQGPAKLWDVRILLGFYGVEDPRLRREHEEWARGTKAESWWESDADLTTDDLDRYFAAETEAVAIRMFCTPVVPALLQTTAYAEAHTRIIFPEWSDDDVLRFVEIRRRRQVPLTATGALKFQAVIDEGAVRRTVGGVDTQHEQLSSLIDVVGERDNVELFVLPFSAGPGRALNPFTIFEPRNTRIDVTQVYHEETPGGGTWLESGRVSEAIEIYKELVALSMGAEESVMLLRQVADSLREASDLKRRSR